MKTWLALSPNSSYWILFTIPAFSLFILELQPHSRKLHYVHPEVETPP